MEDLLQSCRQDTEIEELTLTKINTYAEMMTGKPYVPRGNGLQLFPPDCRPFISIIQAVQIKHIHRMLYNPESYVFAQLVTMELGKSSVVP